MLLKGFPDFIEYNNTQAAKGRPKVSWPEFLRIRKHALIRQEAARSLQEPVQGKLIRLLPPPQETLNARPEAPEASSEGVLSPEGDDGTSCLELTPEMEVLDLPQAISVHALCDGSGPIGSI